MERVKSSQQSSKNPSKDCSQGPQNRPAATKVSSPLAHLQITSALAPILFGILLLWNWRFALSVLAGSFAMNVIVTLRSPIWQQRWYRARQKLDEGDTLPLVLAVVAGAAATLGTFTGLSMLVSASNRWLAAGSIFQGLVSFGILSLLVYQQWGEPALDKKNTFENSLQNVGANDPLVRLLAVRRLMQHLSSGKSTSEQNHIALSCLKLAADKEAESEVKETLLQAVQLYADCYSNTL